MDFKRFIRDVPDYPKLGIIFRDITPLLLSSLAFNEAVSSLADDVRSFAPPPKPLLGRAHQVIAAVESRGFIFGGALAKELEMGLVLIRKAGKLPGGVITEGYDLEYDKAALQVQTHAVPPRTPVVVFDDVLATGGTAVAACNLMRRLGAQVCGCLFLIELEYCKGRQKLDELGIKSFSLVKYD